MSLFEPTGGIMTDGLPSHFDHRAICLIAPVDRTQQLYVWQLFSVLGEGRIIHLIRSFYERIFQDLETPWFRNPFVEAGSIDYHITGQSAMWLDVMGGGKTYTGGVDRLHLYHDDHRGIMTSRGAERWMFHMRQTVYDPHVDLTDDPRVRPCLVSFVEYHMHKYALEFDFKYTSKL